MLLSLLSMIGAFAGIFLLLLAPVGLFIMPAPPRRICRLFAIALPLLCLLLLVLPAMAQGAAPAVSSPNTLFHMPQAAWDEINALVVAFLLAVVTLLFKFLMDRSPLKNTQAEAIARDAFTQLLMTGAKYGITQAQAAEKRVGDIDVGDARIAAAANFVIAQGPGLAAKMGFDVTTPEGRAAIIRSSTVRVADLLTGQHEAPAALQLPAAVAMSGTGTPPESSPAAQNSGGQGG